MLVFYMHVLLKELARYAYLIPNAADDLSLMFNALLPARNSVEKPKIVQIFFTCSRSTNFHVSNIATVSC